MVVAYNGERFCGFQRQISNQQVHKRPPKRPYCDSTTGFKKGIPVTIQECLERAICEWMPQATAESLCLRASSRTDKGVHAKGQVIAVSFPQKLDLESWEIRKAINSRLPVDISVQSVQVTNESFDPRRHVTSKVYSYTIKYRTKTTGSICTSGPHTLRHAHDPPNMWVIPWPLQDDLLESLLTNLTGEHDYTAFVHKSDRSTRDHVMTIESFRKEILEVSEQDTGAPVVTVKVFVQAQAFRRSMVRNLVGFCVDVCRGHIKYVDWDDVWQGSEQAAAQVNAAPACGLCLESVYYE